MSTNRYTLQTGYQPELQLNNQYDSIGKQKYNVKAF